MPVHDLGYREWDGELTSDKTRWMVLTETGIRRVWQSSWVKRILFFAWLPLLVFGGVFWAYEQGVQGSGSWERSVTNMLDEFVPGADLKRVDEENRPLTDQEVLVQNRHRIWMYAIFFYFRYPQGTALVLIVGLIAPRLISEDVSTRAFLFYFSRPLSRLEYIVGKSATVWFFLAMITAAPALVLYLLGIALSPDTSVIAYTWDIPLRVIAAAMVVIVPTTAIALCFSSLSQESRYAGFAWFAMWIVGAIAYGFVLGWRQSQRRSFDQINNFEDLTNKQVNIEDYFSLHHILANVQEWIFGFKSFSEVGVFIVLLSAITVVCFLTIYRRVSAPMRA